MPPPQCPDCGRFLSHDFVEGLAEAPSDCPRCGTSRALDDFVDYLADANIDLAAEALSSEAVVHRAPDGDDDQLRDVLAGWDRPSVLPPAVPVADEDEERFVTAATIVVAGVAGGLVGGLVFPRHRSGGAVFGTLVGAGVGAASSRIFTDMRAGPPTPAPPEP